MAAPVSASLTAPLDRSTIPPAPFNVCFVLLVFNVTASSRSVVTAAA
jgi:hypothetical protein